MSAARQRIVLVAAAALLTSSTAALRAEQAFLLGVGRHDITGPALDCGFMGYANPFQRGNGIHMRLWARAFVIANPDDGRRVAIVCADLGMVFQAVKLAVTERLGVRLGGMFDASNVLLMATHTHSGPGGYSHDALYNGASGGFDRQNFEIIVEGIVAAIIQAQEALRPGTIRIAQGVVAEASWNRSLAAYEKNPPEERARYGDEPVDRTMTQLRFDAADGRPLGVLNWFAVHPTSVGSRNTLISGDNKGYASQLFERSVGTETLPFIAAFAQPSAGDVSPNLWGEPDGTHDDERMAVIGERQFDAARKLFDTGGTALAPRVGFRHAYVRFAGLAVEPRWLSEGGAQTLGHAAVGASVLAGTEDGGGISWFKEGLVYGRNWPAFTLVPQEQARHFEKPVILVTGRGKRPLTPQILPIQVITLGELAIVGVPFETTTMVGRRLRQTVGDALASQGITTVVVAALSNAYAGYVATREEYAAQHYEGASTHFGPFTECALRQECHRLAEALTADEAVDPGPQPPALEMADDPSRLPGDDTLPPDAAPGGVAADAPETGTRGGSVAATFWSGHPRHGLGETATSLRVERRGGDGAWQTVATDDDRATRIRWRRDGGGLLAEVEWRIPTDTAAGDYRLAHAGLFRDAAGVRPFTGHSRSFRVAP